MRTDDYPDAYPLSTLSGIQIYSTLHFAVKEPFIAFLTDNGGIMAVDGYADTMKQFGENVDWTNVNTAITEINKFSAENWDKLKDAFPAFSDVIANSHASLEHMNTF